MNLCQGTVLFCPLNKVFTLYYLRECKSKKNELVIADVCVPSQLKRKDLVVETASHMLTNGKLLQDILENDSFKS